MEGAIQYLFCLVLIKHIGCIINQLYLTGITYTHCTFQWRSLTVLPLLSPNRTHTGLSFVWKTIIKKRIVFDKAQTNTYIITWSLWISIYYLHCSIFYVNNVRSFCFSEVKFFLWFYVCLYIYIYIIISFPKLKIIETVHQCSRRKQVA